ncbi:MAG: hypothetical protein WBP61_19245 [Nocardioides sp.]
MSLLTVLPDALTLVVALVDEVPEEEDVKAGWTAFVIFIGLILAVALLGFSLVKHLRKAEASEEAGLYDPPRRRRTPERGAAVDGDAEPGEPGVDPVAEPEAGPDESGQAPSA